MENLLLIDIHSKESSWDLYSDRSEAKPAITYTFG